MLTHEFAHTFFPKHWGTVASPSEELIRFAEDAAANNVPYQGAERRTQVRRYIAIFVFAQPVTAEMTSVGEPFVAVTRDISTGGLAMFHTAPVESTHLVIELNDFIGGVSRKLFEVLRCNRVKGYYEIAGRFVSELDG